MNDDEAKAHERARARLRAMDPEDRFQTLVDAGIYTSDGELTPGYRDDSEPDPETEQSLVDQIIETAASIWAQTAMPVAEFWIGTGAWDQLFKEDWPVCGFTDPDWRDDPAVARIQGIPIVHKPMLPPDAVVPMVRCPLCVSRPGLCICVQGLVPMPKP